MGQPQALQARPAVTARRDGTEFQGSAGLDPWPVMRRGRALPPSRSGPVAGNSPPKQAGSGAAGFESPSGSGSNPARAGARPWSRCKPDTAAGRLVRLARSPAASFKDAGSARRRAACTIGSATERGCSCRHRDMPRPQAAARRRLGVIAGSRSVSEVRPASDCPRRPGQSGRA